MRGKRAKALRRQALALADELGARPQTTRSVIVRLIRELVIGTNEAGEQVRKYVDVKRGQVVLRGVGRLYRMLKRLYTRGELNPDTERAAAYLAFKDLGDGH